ncbi:ATP-binding protein [Chryseobacterium sp. KMC2]|uniref:HD domain-containing protein n=1 Tax=Chryseobacterium sp. KMC2 TaxID=2800705 RepID=UPI0019224E29|nr:ATP-binding protein [Chryseobacterium sp. KMC2]MBL3548125.1 ATP-binding protein [Chryseobacterium sp. KMC2]
MIDDFKDEYLPRLNKSYLYQTITKKCSEKDSEVIALINDIVSYSLNRTKTIIKHMGEFTLHDSEHLFRVLLLMEKLLPEDVIENLSVPELMLLICSAFMHDVGMAPEEEEVLEWKKVWDLKPSLNEKLQNTFIEFKRFYYSQPHQVEGINKLISQNNFSQADIIKSHIITEYIRKTHADRIKDIIQKHWEGKIKFRDNDLTVELAQICLSHNEEALKLLRFEKYMICGEQIHVCLPLVGIILRLADILDFDAKRTPAVLFSHLYVKEPVSLKEWNKHRAVEAWDISSESIYFTAKCAHPAIESSIHRFCDDIDHELSVCYNLVSELNEFNKMKHREILIKIPYKVSREKITTKKNIHDKPIYIYKDVQFNLSKKQVIELLMGTKLYGNPEVALRELVQNSIDACLLRQKQENKWGTIYKPEVTIKYLTENEDKILIVEDNGTGMDEYIIDNYYSKVGSSFYKSSDFYNMLSENNAEFTPTSRFGIGILSSFMVADTIIVDTKRVYAAHKSSEPINLTIEGQESIFWIKEGSRELPGTMTRLQLRKNKNPWQSFNDAAFIKSVKNSIRNPPFTINIITDNENISYNEENFDSITTNDLKDGDWSTHPNVQYYTIKFDDVDRGIKGVLEIGILQSKGVPTHEIELPSKTIDIAGVNYELDKKVWLRDNSIQENSTHINISDDYNINTNNSSRTIAKSKSRLSLHGIDIPTSLFPEWYYKRDNQAVLSFPFPILIIVDAFGKTDLDLNSARTEIVLSDKWRDFEKKLSQIICKELSNQIDPENWKKLKDIFLKSSNNEVFKDVLNSF